MAVCSDEWQLEPARYPPHLLCSVFDPRSGWEVRARPAAQRARDGSATWFCARIRVPYIVRHDTQTGGHMKIFSGRVALVTGGASGIGYGMVQNFLQLGMKVVIVDFNSAYLGEVRQSLGERADVIFVQA